MYSLFNHFILSRQVMPSDSEVTYTGDANLYMLRGEARFKHFPDLFRDI